MKRSQTAAPDRPYHHGELRAALLEAAAALLTEGGVESISLRECARRAGVSHAAPYRHFTSKEELVAALAEEGFDRLRQAGEKAMDGIRDARERLDAYGVAYVRFARENPERFRLMFTGGATHLKGEAPCAGSAFELLRGAVHAVVGDVDDLEAAAAAFWALPHGLAMLMLDGRISQERIPNSAAAAKLARDSFRYWRHLPPTARSRKA